MDGTMKHKSPDHGILWIVSEICYYLGLVLLLCMAAFTLVMAATILVLWMLDLVDNISLNYWYILIAWILSALVFLSGVALKNIIYSVE